MIVLRFLLVTFVCACLSAWGRHLFGPWNAYLNGTLMAVMYILGRGEGHQSWPSDSASKEGRRQV